MAIVCKTYEGVKTLETYDLEGGINNHSGIQGLGSSIGRHLDGRFRIICIEHLRYETHILNLGNMELWFVKF